MEEINSIEYSKIPDLSSVSVQKIAQFETEIRAVKWMVFWGKRKVFQLSHIFKVELTMPGFEDEIAVF